MVEDHAPMNSNACACSVAESLKQEGGEHAAGWTICLDRYAVHDSLGRVPPLTFLPRPSSSGQSPFELSA
jgi:hypothetical protein